MASENKGIGDTVKNCKILLLDIEGTTTSINFVKDKLFPYAEENVKQFLEIQWDKDDVKAVVTALRKLAIEDKEGSVEGVVDIPNEDASKEEQIEGVVNNVKWQMLADRKGGPLKTLQGLIWKQGYDNGDIKGHVFDDVSAALEQWHSAEDQKVYIYSSGSVQAQKLLFGQSLAGDLLKFIDGHFDTAVGAKQEAASYKTIAEKIGCKPEEILFLTDILKEAEAARSAGMNAALVSREGNAPLPATGFPVIHSFSELSASNKRKPDQQVDETPAKIPKTDSEETKTAEAESTTAPTVQETMEVEDKAEVTKVETVVEEVTDSNEAAPVVEDIEPVVIEEKKTDEDAEMTPVNPVDVETKDPEVKPVAETISDVVIEDVTDKMEGIEEMIVDDVKAIVEEPAVPDLDELANVGEVLEKECDEILSKVSNVTNLDNITVKPMLNSIAEENVLLEENGDTNDIVDNILDSELEMEERADTEIDPSTVSEMNDEKTEEDKVDDTIEAEVNDVPKTAELETKVETTEEIKAAEPKETAELDTNLKTKTTEEIKPTEPKETAELHANLETKTTEEIKPTEPKETAELGTNLETKTTGEIKPTENNKETVTGPETPKEMVEEKTETEVTEAAKVEEKKVTENKTEEQKEMVVEPEEPKMNGKAVNGDVEQEANGDAKSNGDDVSSRLAVTNGKVNGDGANGDSAEVEQGQGDCKVADIKVKTVAAEEPRPDPVDQPATA